jgi:hypothetical protein
MSTRRVAGLTSGIWLAMTRGHGAGEDLGEKAPAGGSRLSAMVERKQEAGQAHMRRWPEVL